MDYYYFKTPGLSIVDYNVVGRDLRQRTFYKMVFFQVTLYQYYLKTELPWGRHVSFRDSQELKAHLRIYSIKHTPEYRCFVSLFG